MGGALGCSQWLAERDRLHLGIVFLALRFLRFFILFYFLHARLVLLRVQ